MPFSVSLFLERRPVTAIYVKEALAPVLQLDNPTGTELMMLSRVVVVELVRLPRTPPDDATCLAFQLGKPVSDVDDANPKTNTQPGYADSIA